MDDKLFACEDEFGLSIEELNDGRFDVLGELVLLRRPFDERFSTL